MFTSWGLEIDMVLIASIALIGVQGQLAVPLYKGLGPHHRKVATSSPLAQRYFDQGLNLLMAFNHDEARISFKEAVRLDPECAMAWWGVATTNGPHINNTAVDAVREKEAVDALAKAGKAKHIRAVERDLITAAKVRFADPQPKDRAPLDRAYAAAMRKVWQKHSSDPDVGAMFAESLMDLRPWDLWKADGSAQPETPEVLKTLRTVLKLDKKNPLANHLYIHAVEASPHPEWGLASAARLRDLQPGLGHNTHMPSHIDVRTGRWQEAVTSNIKAIRSDARYAAQRPEQGFYRLYMAHNQHMLGFAAMMTGQSQLAVKSMDKMVADMPKDLPDDLAAVLDGFFSMPFEVRIRFGMWDQVLALPEVGAKFPVSVAMRHAARAIAYAAKRELEQAKEEEELFLVAVGKVPEGAAFGNATAADILKIARLMTRGEILVAEGDLKGGATVLSEAVQAEDQLRYDEPPDWILSVRHPLGAVLLKDGRPADALKVYQADLKKWPDNGWSLLGLSQAYEKLGKKSLAASYKKKFATIWANADMTPTTSCLCVK